MASFVSFSSAARYLAVVAFALSLVQFLFNTAVHTRLRINHQTAPRAGLIRSVSKFPLLPTENQELLHGTLRKDHSSSFNDGPYLRTIQISVFFFFLLFFSFFPFFFLNYKPPHPFALATVRAFLNSFPSLKILDFGTRLVLSRHRDCLLY